ncbi:hypothetical protein FEM48_Zijuj09G0036500 [Ziziphus jujuba var. spinosa]|nr:hypothetical protein FEM48_Zijuj09G0036500 [Ziziphus jujuba var. spinosa]
MQPSRLVTGFKPRVHHHQKDKVVFVLGATGTGKSRLSIDLANRFFPAEIINSDKIQAYQGLDIVTNKITKEEQRGVPHHLLGIADPNANFTVTDFCEMTLVAVESISRHNSLPIIAGGSNSYMERLIEDNNYNFKSKYDCCFLWVDVSMPVLHSFLHSRVDEMIRNGMVDEVRSFFDPNADYSTGIRKAIGVQEFDDLLRNEPFLDDNSKARLLQQAIDEIKANNCTLARRQLEKIRRLRMIKGWNLLRLDATDVFRKRGKDANQAWEKLVVNPSEAIVRRFLYGLKATDVPSSIPAIPAPTRGPAVAAASL